VKLNEDLTLMKRQADWWPEVEIVERDHCLVARLALRDVAKDDLSVFVDDGGLVVEGDVTNLTRAKFRRPIPFTDGVRPEEVKATFTGGVLELTVPVLPTATARPPRKVTIAIAPDQSDEIVAGRRSPQRHATL
jgi:HSP20 family molecular chaperone IbpA